MLWSEDECEAAITLSGEPSIGFLRHMRRVIVENDLDRRVGRVACIELLEEADEFARAVAVFDAGMNLSGEQVDACSPATGGRSGAVLEIAWMPGFSS